MANLDKSSYIPLYRQLVENITQKIDSGELKPGDRLPSEREMAEDLKVSRITARQALDALEQLGLVYREQGRGTFVAVSHLYGIEGFSSLSEYVMRRGLRPRSRILKQEVVDADDRLLSCLKLEPGEKVLHLERLRLADDSPLAFQSSYIPCRLAPGLEDEDLRSRSLFDTLREKYAVYPTWTEPEICATKATEAEAELLELSPGDPVMVVTAVTYTSAFEIVEQVRTVYRGTDFWLYLGRQRVSK